MSTQIVAFTQDIIDEVALALRRCTKAENETGIPVTSISGHRISYSIHRDHTGVPTGIEVGLAVPA